MTLPNISSFFNQQLFVSEEMALIKQRNEGQQLNSHLTEEKIAG